MTILVRHLAGGILVLFAASVLNAGPAEGCDPEQAYCPSLLQQRVDKSFSAIAIQAPFESVRHTLTEDRGNGCEQWGECDWVDANKVRHYLWGEPDNLYVVLKTISAKDLVGRPISALGIGLARRRKDVLANVQKAFPELHLKCDENDISSDVGPIECNALLDPGWIEIGFDKSDNLLAIRFDGYHFT